MCESSDAGSSSVHVAHTVVRTQYRDHHRTTYLRSRSHFPIDWSRPTWSQGDLASATRFLPWVGSDCPWNQSKYGGGALPQDPTRPHRLLRTGAALWPRLSMVEVRHPEPLSQSHRWPLPMDSHARSRERLEAASLWTQRPAQPLRPLNPSLRFLLQAVAFS